jgi:hypothetical protein
MDTNYDYIKIIYTNLWTCDNKNKDLYCDYTCDVKLNKKLELHKTLDILEIKNLYFDVKTMFKFMKIIDTIKISYLSLIAFNIYSDNCIDDEFINGLINNKYINEFKLNNVSVYLVIQLYKYLKLNTTVYELNLNYCNFTDMEIIKLT